MTPRITALAVVVGVLGLASVVQVAPQANGTMAAEPAILGFSPVQGLSHSPQFNSFCFCALLRSAYLLLSVHVMCNLCAGSCCWTPSVYDYGQLYICYAPWFLTTNGICQPCMKNSPTYQYRTLCGSPSTSPGGCTNCPTCGTGYYRNGCGPGISVGSCPVCPLCPYGLYRFSCGVAYPHTSLGSCVSMLSLLFALHAHAHNFAPTQHNTQHDNTTPHYKTYHSTHHTQRLCQLPDWVLPFELW